MPQSCCPPCWPKRARPLRDIESVPVVQCPAMTSCCSETLLANNNGVVHHIGFGLASWPAEQGRKHPESPKPFRRLMDKNQTKREDTQRRGKDEEPPSGLNMVDQESKKKKKIFRNAHCPLRTSLRALDPWLQCSHQQLSRSRVKHPPRPNQYVRRAQM